MSWIEYNLEEVASISSGFAFKSNEMSIDSGTPVIKIKNINDRKVYKKTDTYLPSKFYNIKYDKYILKEGDILVAMTGQGSVGRIGKMYNVDGEYLINQRVGIIKAKENICNDDFLFQLIATPENEKKYFNLAQGAGQPNLSPKDIGTLQISIPTSLETQKRIASILSNYDDLIENNLKRIKLLEETAQNIYKEWFVNFRFPNYEHTDFDSESGLPVGWEINKADNVYDIKIGKTPPRGETQWFSLTDGIKWVSISDMNKSTVFVINTNEKITKDGVDKFNMRKASIGSVLLSFKLTVGSVAITNEEVVSNEAIAHFNLLEDSILTTEYTYQFLKNFHYPSLGSTSSIGISINSKIVKNMDIVIPTKNLIEDFTTSVKNIFAQTENLISQNQKLKEARDILLPRLMNRTIEV